MGEVSRAADGIGAAFHGAPGERVKRLGVNTLSGTVFVDILMLAGDINEGLMYLTPSQAMRLAAGLERCAIAALKDGAS